jgi:hypothetical protein
MKIERQWFDTKGNLEIAKEITEDRANRELANAHGDNAVIKLEKEGKLETRFAVYTLVK